MTDSLRCRLAQGTPLLGTIISLAAPEAAELLSGIGFDWLFVDMEHSPLGVLEVQRILQAVEPGCSTVVRVPANEEVWIKRAMDLGCDGIIIPQVNTPEAAARAVRWARYPPEGARGVGIGRAHRYGLRFAEYVARANRDLAIIVQAEHVEAVTHIQDIVRVPGIDAVFVGPYDLSGSVNKTGQIDDPEVRSMIEAIRQACQEVGMPLGVYVGDADAARPFIAQGYVLIAMGVDVVYMSMAAGQMLAALRG